jgi:hypothetical protein
MNSKAALIRTLVILGSVADDRVAYLSEPEAIDFGVDMARRFSNALLDGRAPVKNHRIGFEKTLARF